MPLDICFYDYIKLTKPTDNELTQFKDYLGSNFTKNSLLVRMAATHSGIININRRFYIPSRMEEGVNTFRFDKKPTKILKHHNSEADPVGVVRGAAFIPTVPEDLKDNPDVMTLMSHTASIKDQLKSMRSLIRSGVLNREDWIGLGYIDLVAEIMDRETIEQIKDQRYDAVSASFRSPGHAYCSICAQNIVKDGYCEHETGQLYNDDVDDDFKFPAMVIPGIHQYQETSFVVFDADPLTTVEIIDETNEANNKTYYLPNESTEDLMSAGTSFEFKDSVVNREDKNMFDITKLSDAERKIFDAIKELRPDTEDTVLGEYACAIAGLADKDGIFPDQVEAELDELTMIQYMLEDLETKDQEIDSDEICDEMQKELLQMKEEQLLSDEEFEVADAKLSSKQRKNLGSSTFCGPKRSFPVPDCAHVTAARRLIGRYKGPGSKSSILACVARKAKALGCGGSSDSVKKPLIEDVPCVEKTLKDMKDDELRNLFHSAELELIGRKLTIKRDCSDCAKHIADTERATKELVEAKEKIADMENTFAVLRAELKMSYSDYFSQADECVNLNTQLYTLKAEKLALVGVLTNKYDNLEDAMDKLKESKDINAEEIVIMDSFNLEDVKNKLNDGMARKPEGSVESPVVTLTEKDQVFDNLTPSALAAIENIREHIKIGDRMSAKRLYDKMRSLKLFNDTITFDSISADDQADDLGGN